MEYKRLTLIAGHYGSGKTNIAVNLSYDLKDKGFNRVAIADLDIVNPYFRTKDSIEQLPDKGIDLIRSPYAGSNVDIPAIPQEMYALTDDTSISAIIDIGGDDRGALALGRYVPAIVKENDYSFYLVINCYRPLTGDVPSTLEIMKEIEQAAGIRFTGIINNSNVGADTKKEHILNSLDYANEVSKVSGLPLVMTTVEASLFDDLKDEIHNLFPLQLQSRIFEK